MKSIVLQEPGNLDSLVTKLVESREPGIGEMRVRIHANSLNFHDYAVVKGFIPNKKGLVPLSDGAGVVEAVGEGVLEFNAGDHVMSCFFPNWEDGAPSLKKIGGCVPGDNVDGFASESVTMPERFFTKIPVGYSFDEAATLPCAALTAWRALFVEAKVKPGTTVLVQGSGGVSIFALQFAKTAGCRVVATSSSDEKLAKLKALGADILINYKKEVKWGKKAFELTDGNGVDVVIETGGSGTLSQSISAVAFGGHISMIGILTGNKGELSADKVFMKNVSINGISVGSRQHQKDMVAAIEVNGIKPVISHRFALTEITEAFKLQESHGHFGKICLSY